MKRFSPALLLLLFSCSGAPYKDEPRPNILLITVDTLSADALGWVGGKNATPVLDQLAAEGAAFSHATSHVPLTLPSHTSIMTGLLPIRHGVPDNGRVVPGAVQTLAESLKAKGYHTGAFVSGFPLKAMFGLNQGFDTYDDHVTDGREGWLERKAEVTTQAALDWAQKAEGPWFMWVHYYDPHDPYEPPREFWAPNPKGAYLGEVQYTDYQIGKLLAGLPTAGERLTIVTADHGEALGEHQERTHGYFVYDSTMLVPLIFHAPGHLKPQLINRQVRTVDIMPTVLTLLGEPNPTNVDGISLLPTLLGKSQDIPPAYMETQLPWLYFGWAPLQAIRNEDGKYIRAPRQEFYDLTTDPGETENLYEADRSQADPYRHFLTQVESLPAIESESVLDPAAMEQLRSLGYVGSGASATKPPANAADPKDKIEERQFLLEAENRLAARQYNEALAMFQEILAKDPDHRYATIRAGITYLKSGQFETAVPLLKKAVAQDPDRAEARFGLAQALILTGQTEGAVEQWMELANRQPANDEVWSNLGNGFSAMGRPAQAVTAFQKALDLKPEHPAYMTQLACVLVDGKYRKEAMSLMKQAQAITGAEDFPTPGNLGLLMMQQGDPEAGAALLSQMRDLEPNHGLLLFNRAALAAAAGDRTEAQRFLKQALRFQPQLTPRAENHPQLKDLLEP